MRRNFTSVFAGVVCLLFLLLIFSTARAQLTGISVYAGGGTRSNQCATCQSLVYPIGMVMDTSGVMYIADSGGIVHRRTPDGYMGPFAGGGTAGAIDSGLALDATLSGPSFLAFDPSGNLYLTENPGQRLRKITLSGIITTIAGTGLPGFSGDGGPATLAQLNNPTGLAVDAVGNIYIADEGNNRIRKINTAGIITTIAGTGVAGHNGDSIPAASAELNAPYSLAVDGIGNLYIGEVGGQRVRKIDTTGMILSLAGPEIAGDSTQPVVIPTGLSDINGTLIISDAGINRLRIVGDSGVSTIGIIDDNTPYGATPVNNPRAIAFTNNQNYNVSGFPNIPMSSMQVVEKAGGDVLSIVSDRYYAGIAGDGDTVYASNPDLVIDSIHTGPWGVQAAKQGGNVYFTDSNTVRSIPPAAQPFVTILWNASLYNDNIQPFIGTGAPGYAGDGGPADSALLTGTFGLWKDPLGQIYTGTQGDNRIRKVDLAGIIRTFAGTGSAGYSGDGGPATTAAIRGINGLGGDYKGNVYFSDSIDAVVRKIDTNGIITTFAGTGTPGYSGDGGRATSAQLGKPNGISADPTGNIYIADNFVNTVRKVDTNGIITTVAGGSDSRGLSGDYGPATTATFGHIINVWSDVRGNLYILDNGNNNIRIVNGGTGIITPFAGAGGMGYFPYTFSSLSSIAQDSANNIYLGDAGSHEVLKATVSYTLPDSTKTVEQYVAPPMNGSAAAFNPTFFTDDSFHRIAILTPVSNNNSITGNVTIKETVDTGVLVVAQLPFLGRHYDIISSSDSSVAQLTLYVTADDINKYNNYIATHTVPNASPFPLDPYNTPQFFSIIQFTGTGTTPFYYSTGQAENDGIVSVDSVVDGNGKTLGYSIAANVTGTGGLYIYSGAFEYPPPTLPLTLLSFTGQLQGTNNALLNWTTTNEVNTKTFFVQRGQDSSAFSTVGTVAASSMPGTNQYSFTDDGLAAGTWLFRLQMEDQDGSLTYSKIISLTVGASGAAMVLYPNPVEDLLSVQLTTVAAGRATVQLTDMRGQVLQQQEVELNAGVTTLSFKTAALSAGGYLIVVRGGDGSKTVQGFMRK